MIADVVTCDAVRAARDAVAFAVISVNGRRAAACALCPCVALPLLEFRLQRNPLGSRAAFT